MKKLLSVTVLSLALLVPAQMALAASNEDKVLAKIEQVEKEIKTLRNAINARLQTGKKLTDAQMNEGMKMMETASNAIRYYERRLDRDLGD